MVKIPLDINKESFNTPHKQADISDVSAKESYNLESVSAGLIVRKKAY